MRTTTKDAIAAAIGSEVVTARSVGGGSINEAYACELADGRRVFVKANADGDPRMFPLEQRGLKWLGEAKALRTPEVIAVNEPSNDVPFLVMELIEPAARSSSYDADLGRGLAALHAFGAPSFGLDHDNFLATLEQDNTTAESWPEFYARQRLEPQVKMAIDTRSGPSRWSEQFEALYKRLGDLVGEAEPPSRLHGDLWSGNLHTDANGNPVLIDPAVYGGHREIDLAMLRLFGSPSRTFFDVYHETFPLAPGSEDRVSLYQLYPLLAHVNLFGGSYAASVQSALDRYL